MPYYRTIGEMKWSKQGKSSEKAIDPLKIRSIDRVRDRTNTNRGRRTYLFKGIARQNKKLEERWPGPGIELLNKNKDRWDLYIIILENPYYNRLFAQIRWNKADIRIRINLSYWVRTTYEMV